jgi:hypothetical protein
LRDGLALGAADVWRAAAQAVPSGESLLAVRSVEPGRLNLSSISLSLVAHPARSSLQSDGPPAALDLGWIRLDDHELGSLEGLVAPSADFGDGAVAPLVSCLSPILLGRYHLDFAADGIQLAHPGLIEDVVVVVADEDGLHLDGWQGRYSSWQYWNADWEPTRPREIPRFGGFVTTIQTDVLNAFLDKHGLSVGRHGDVTIGSRDYDYGEMKFAYDRLWF